MPAVSPPRRRVQLFLVPLIATFCMAFIIGAIILDNDAAVCPTPTWNNQLSLQLAGNDATAAKAAAITACMGADCVPPGSTTNRAGTTRALIHEDDGSWRLSLGSQPASTINFTIYDREGAVLSSQSAQVNWTRISGSERCGGAMADVGMVLDLPASAAVSG